jgi:hypothetical protein
MSTSSENSSQSEDKTAQLIEYVETLVTLNEQQEEVNAELSNRVESRINEVSAHVDQQMDVILNTVQQKLNQFLDDLAAPLSHALENRSNDAHSGQAIEANAKRAESSEDIDGENDAEGNAGEGTPSEWEKQKKAMLADFGIDPNSDTQDSPKKGSLKNDSLKTEQPVASETPLLDVEPAQEVLEALHDSIESIENIDSEEIENLKTQLTSKLRDAEVELSINRAKLSQQWATLEQRQFEIEQRENNLKSKYANVSSTGETSKKQGMLDRLSRHLSRSSHDIDADDD